VAKGPQAMCIRDHGPLQRWGCFVARSSVCPFVIPPTLENMLQTPIVDENPLYIVTCTNPTPSPTDDPQVTLTASGVNEEVTVLMAAGVVADLAGNTMGASNTLLVYYNALPYATLVSRSVNYYTQLLTAEFVFTMNQAVTWRWKVVNAFNYTDYGVYTVGSASDIAAGTEQTVSVSFLSLTH
jgi:hypothetical protein